MQLTINHAVFPRSFFVWVVALFFLSTTCLAQSSSNNGWADEFYYAGLNGTPSAYLNVGTDVFVAGSFSTAGPILANSIARYDGTHWHTVGDGLNGSVEQLVLFEDTVVACGIFTLLGDETQVNVARFDGQQWSALGERFAIQVHALAVFDGILYCDGFRWNGTQWEVAYETDGDIQCFEVFENQLIVGGDFTTANGLSTGNTFAWDGHTVLNSFPDQWRGVLELVDFQGTLFGLCSQYTNSDFVPVMMWQGDAWVPAGNLSSSGVFTRYRALAVVGQTLQVAYSYFYTYTETTSGLRKWTGQAWQDVPGTYWSNATVRSIHGYRDGALVGGTFSRLGVCNTRNIAGYDEQGAYALSPPGLGASSTVLMFAAQASLAIGGWFSSIGGVDANRLAVYCNGDWQTRALPGSPTRSPLCLTWHENDLHAVAEIVSDYTQYSKLVFSNGQWFGSNLLEGQVPYCMLSTDERLLLGGADLYELLPSPAQIIWPIDELGPTDTIVDLAFWQGRVVAGGQLSLVDTTTVAGVSVYNGTNWEALGEGIDGVVFCLAEFAGDLIAGGRFDFAGGEPASNIAAWDGSHWQALGDGLDNDVRCLEVTPDGLFAGGRFTSSGSTELPHIAHWDGQQWLALGTGTNGVVYDLQWYENRLWVGGEFTQAGGRCAAGLTTWSENPVPVYLQDLTAERLTDGVHVTWTTASAGTGTFIVRRSTAGRQGQTIDALPAVGQTGFTTIDPAAPTESLTYTLALRTSAGTETVMGQATVAAADLPALSRIQTVSPNPFNPLTTIRFNVAQSGAVRLVIYDLAGRQVCTLIDETRPAGDHTVQWSGQDNQGRKAPSGSYLMRLTTVTGVSVAKATLVQ